MISPHHINIYNYQNIGEFIIIHEDLCYFDDVEARVYSFRDGVCTIMDYTNAIFKRAKRNGRIFFLDKRALELYENEFGNPKNYSVLYDGNENGDDPNINLLAPFIYCLLIGKNKSLLDLK